jgi:DNA segregation ATPase FtsK/SpoIIIE, S-DNA-T family
MQNILFSTRRQRQVLRGLQQRIAQCRSKNAEASSSTEQRLELLEQEFLESDKKTKVDNRTALMHTLTEWDYAVENVWAEAEKSAFQSLQKEVSQLNALQKKYQALQATATTQHKTANEKLSKDYDVVKLQPGKQLEKSKVELRNQVAKTSDLFQQTQLVITQRSLRVPSVSSELKPDDVEVDSVRQGHEKLDSLRAELAGAFDRIRKHTISRYSAAIIALGSLGIGGISTWATFQYYANSPIIVGGVGLAGIVIGAVALMLMLRPIFGKVLRVQYPIVQSAWDKSQAVAVRAAKRAEEFCKWEQIRLLEEFKTKKAQLESDYQQAMTRFQNEANEGAVKIRSGQRALRAKSAVQHTAGLQESNQSWKPRLDALRKQYEQDRLDRAANHCQAVEQLKLDHRQSLTYLRQRLGQGVSEAEKFIQETSKATADVFPNWNDSFWSKRPWARNNRLATIPIGEMHVAVDASALEESNGEKAMLNKSLPLHFRLIEDGYLLLQSNPESQVAAHQVLKNVLLRALTSMPAGNVQLTIIDPIDLGREFSWLMHLADTDPKMVNYRVWTQNTHINEQLSRLVHHTEDVIQQLLRDKYRDIREYNVEAGSMAEPHRIVVWSRFPAGIDDTSWKALSSLLSSGGRCGVSVLLLEDPSLPWPSMVDRGFLDNGGLRLQIDDANRSLRVQDSVLGEFSLEANSPPDEAKQNELLRLIAEDASKAGRVEVPFETIVPSSMELFHASTAEGLHIPIGQAGIGRSQYLKLGVGTSQHVLIAGKTGSGKSSLLHTMITSAALRYGPDQLRMVLLDFKKGVEFQVYSECRLPHADIIGIESQREFGLSALEYLDRVMQKRGEAFRQAGVQDVPSWVRKFPETPMPRILVVIDEFQELFVEDDKLAQQASMLLDRVVRQGRSFGIHVVLASQTLGGAYSLPRTTLAQMAVRIALQCEGSDAMIILSEDNLAAERLRHAGQAIYNDSSGRVEGNSPFQVAYISKAVQETRFAVLPDINPFIDERLCSLGRQVVFDGHRPATWDPQVCEQALAVLPSRDATAVGAVLGDSVSIEPAVAFSLSRQAGRNVLIVGTEDRNAADITSAILTSAVFATRAKFDKLPQIFAIDGSRPDDEYAAQLPKLIRLLDPQSQVGDVRTSSDIVKLVHQELTSRVAATDTHRAPVFFVLSQLARLRDLRKSDEFSFGGSDEDSLKPDVMLQEILRDGPGLGVHTIVWIDNWNSLSRWIARQSMHDLEIRILMQMSSNDSNNLIDSPIANRLDSHVLLVYDEAAGTMRKFRPYRMSDIPTIAAWAIRQQSISHPSTDQQATE